MTRNIFVALMYGQGGQATDIMLSGDGLGHLATRIRNLSSAIGCPPPFTWDQAAVISRVIQKLPDSSAIVIGGASLGANEAPRAASAAERKVDLVFGIQPSLMGVHNLVTKNVDKAVCFFNPIPFFALGAYQYKRAADNQHTAMIPHYTYAMHPGDNVQWIQDKILAEIKALL